ncbi:MAG: helix-turn-helix domain protein [Haloquadratum sp. J07HQX50]|nr:MAG: helix-turn-helix domain protein [Haloquadratum sp. J07HQX50]
MRSKPPATVSRHRPERLVWRGRENRPNSRTQRIIHTLRLQASIHPTESQRETLDSYRDTCRQLYNHALNQRVRLVCDQPSNLKDWWNDLIELYSTVAQAAVMRIEDSMKALSTQTKRAQCRESQLESTQRVSEFHIRAVWL